MSIGPAEDWYCRCKEPAPDRIGQVPVLRPASQRRCSVCFTDAPWLEKVSPSIGDQVKITDRAHPWSGAIGVVRDRFANQDDDYWEIELETILPGQRAMVHGSEFRHVA